MRSDKERRDLRLIMVSWTIGLMMGMAVSFIGRLMS
jgi:hypothetical protein